MPDCREKIIRELDGKLTIGEIEHIFEKIEKRMLSASTVYPKELATDAEISAYKEKLKAQTNDQRWGKAVQEAFDEAIQEKKDALKREYLQTARNDVVLKYIQTRGQERIGGSGNARGHVEAVLDMLVGDLRGTQKVLTLEARKNGILGNDLGELYAGFDNYLGAIGFKFTDDNALNIIKEMDAPGSSGDNNARTLVELFTRVSDRNRLLKNEAGANIGYLKDHRIRQSWDAHGMKTFGLTWQEKAKLLDPVKTTAAEKAALYEKARDTFIKEALVRVDRDKYVEQIGMPLTDEDLVMVLNEVFNSITTNGLSDTPAVGTGKRSLAAKLGEHRELHFKSAADWHEFNKAAGNSDILGTMLKSIVQDSKDIALLETLGPNPLQGFETALEWAKHLDAMSGLDADKIEAKALRARHIFNEISQMRGEEGNRLASNFFRNLRNWTVATKGGAILLSQINDLATFAAIARTDGLGMGDGLKLIAQNLNPLNASDRRAAKLAYIGTLSATHDAGSRFGAATRGVSLSSKAANLTIRLGGVKYWTDSVQGAFQELIGIGLHDASTMEFKALPERFRQMLERYGINDADWQTIRKAEAVEINGEKMITPLSVKMLGNTPELRETAIKVAAMMDTEAKIAIVEPGARQISWATEDAPGGTKLGEFAKSFWLFRNFSIALAQKVLPRVWGIEGGWHRAGLTAQYALTMMIAGGASYQLKQIMFGKNPQDITDPKFWLAATAQSGGMGIFGDFFLQKQNRFGGGLVGTIGGPMLGLGDDVLNLTVGNIWQAGEGKESHFGAEAIQFAKNWGLGPANMFYTRAALDHLLFFTVQEAANPGYLRRMRHRAEQDGRTFWWDPQDTLPEEAPDMRAMIGEK